MNCDLQLCLFSFENSSQKLQMADDLCGSEERMPFFAKKANATKLNLKEMQNNKCMLSA